MSSRLSATLVARLTLPRTARLEANACGITIWPVTVWTLPNIWHTIPANAVSGMDATEGVLASSSAPISSWGSQTDLHNSECVSASDGLRDSTIVSRPQLFSSFGVTAGSDDVVDHEASGPAHSSVNDINDTDTSSRSKRKSPKVFFYMAGNAFILVISSLKIKTIFRTLFAKLIPMGFAAHTCAPCPVLRNLS